MLKEGESIAIEIPFTASPQPKVSWEHNKGMVDVGRRIKCDTIRNMTSLCIGKIKVADAGTYQCTLSNKHGKCTISIHITVHGKPTAPQDLVASNVNSNKVTIKWDAPRSDGGKPIRHYVIEKRDVARQAYSQVGTSQEHEFTVTRLTEGNEYVFQVCAVNEVGVGEPAELSQGITAKSPFSKYYSLYQ